MWTEIRRKLFHLTAMIYVVGIIYLPRRAYVVILAVALAAAIAVEAARLRRPEINAWILRKFGPLFREREASRPTGVVWMLAGVLATVVVAGPVPIAATAILYLILGDAAASLVGIRFGGRRWPGSDKRISGSVACLVVCIVVGAVLIAPAYGWRGVLVGALAATALEKGVAAVAVNDNFSIPVGSAVALLASCGVPPFTGLL